MVTEALMNIDWIKWMSFCVNEFVVGVNDSIFPDNEQLKVYYNRGALSWNSLPVEILNNYNQL